MAHPRLKRSEVRRRYVLDRQPLTGAAKIAGISYETARAWKRQALERGDDWDKARESEVLRDGTTAELNRVVLNEFVPLFRSTIIALSGDQMSATDKAEAISRLSDAYAKTIKAAGAVDPKIARLAWAMDVLKELAQFVQTQFPQHAQALLEILEPFGEHLAEQYG